MNNTTQTAPALKSSEARSILNVTVNLLERAAPLEKLLGWFREAASGEGRLVFLAGEAGVGKTVFTRTFCKAAGNSARVLVGACDPVSTPRPLEPLVDMAAALGGELKHLLQQAGGRNQAFRSFLNTLQHSAKPVVVVFEDVHWADEATLDLLRFLGRRMDSAHALLIASFRDEEVGPRHPLRVVIGDLATSPATRRLMLSRLSQEAVSHLAAETGIDPGTLYRQTNGNPFFVTEVIASGARGVPPTVRDAVLARTARLSPAAQQAMEAAAVIGSRAEVWLLETVFPNPAALDECLGAGMLQAEGTSLAFRHDLARQAILETVSPQQRVHLHRCVLEALRAQSVSAHDYARLAHHAQEAGDPKAVLHYAPLAARRASGFRAHREAAAQYARALGFAGQLAPAERALLLEDYAEECLITGQLAEATEARQEALGIWQRAGNREKEGENLAQLARLFLSMGQNARAEQASQESLTVLGSLPAGPKLAFAYWYQSHLRMLNRDNADAVRWGMQAVNLAENCQDGATVVLALGTVGTAMLLAGQEEGRSYLERSIELAREAQLDQQVALAYGNLGSVAGELYQFPQADQYLGAGLRYCAEHDIEGQGQYIRAWQALSWLYQGQWSRASEAALSVTRVSGGSAISRIMALVALGRVRTRRGDPEALSALDEALAMAVQTATLQRLAPVHAARAEAAWLAGDQGRVLGETGEVLELAVRHQHAWFVGELAYWRWKAGDTGVHAEMYAPMTATPFALQMAGQWREAADEWRRLRCPYEAARALAESDDEAALKEALNIFDSLGARPAATMTARYLREHGVRGIPRGPRAAARANPAHLTTRELEVLQLLQQGLQNAEIARKLHLSTKTAGHHVSSILSKLGVRSRTEAVREATRLALIQRREPDSST